MHLTSFSKIFSGGHKGQKSCWATNQRRDGNKLKPHLSLHPVWWNIIFQSCREGTWTYDPLCESGHASFLLSSSSSSSSPPLHFTSTGSGVCQHPPSSQTGLFNHLNTNPTCLYHTMQVSVSRLDNHTPSPLDPSHQNSSSALLFKNCARTHINIELVFWQLNVKNITISQCFVSCQIQPSFPGGMRSSEFLRVLTRSAIAATKVSL